MSEPVVEPTEAMLIAARDWSQHKYGKPIGNDAAIGCWKAMLAAAPAVSGERVREALSQNETLIKAVAEELNKHSPMKWEGFVPKHWEPMAQVILHAIDRALPLTAIKGEQE